MGQWFERVVVSSFYQDEHLTYNLFRQDFTTSKRMVDAINRILGTGTAHALDASSVRVSAPKEASQRVDFVSILENIEVIPDISGAKIRY